VDPLESRNNSGRQGIALLPRRDYRRDSAGGELALVQELLQAAPSPIAHEFLAHYYISAKSWPLVLLVGRPGVGKRHLFHLLSGGIAGGSSGQIRLLPAQPSRQERSDRGESPARPPLDSIQGRFNTMAFLDLLAESTTPGNEGRAYFICLDQATPEELVGYTQLYLTPHQRNEGPPPLPANLYLTAVVPTASWVWQLPAALLNRIGLVEVTVPLEGEEALPPRPCPPVGWQRLFLRSALRDPELARQRLQEAGVLEEFQSLLAQLADCLGPEAGPGLEEGVLLYTASSFTAEGEGLLDGSAMANLQQALDLQLFQRILPAMGQRSSWTQEGWERLIGQLDGRFPRAHARARRILIDQSAAGGTEDSG